ncbi:nitrous oxide reductase family maturation protein NosD [Streptomyces sp. NPDC052236]|uniref:nitrous oxide reductase family maturation protein NosD n=1 Tax=Streptomyces sp. NPDC052236 TaxID=3365686 RepID=UPI0037D578D4
MTKRQITCLACIAAATISGLGAAAPTAGADSPVVRPGQSIQRAVNAAKPGDTITIAPGVYRESVLVTKPGLTLRGSGTETVIIPAAKPPKGTPKAKSTCAQGANGICVMGTADRNLNHVTIRSLTVAGFKESGIWASRTDRLTVLNVTARNNGIWGIAQERSTRGQFRNNTARVNGDAGLFLANSIDQEGGATDTNHALIRGNELSGNRIGVTVRRLRNLDLSYNTITGNCAGVFVVGDESKPAAGAMTITDNKIVENNKSCPATERLPALQGSGIVLTGSESTLIHSNRVMKNAGRSPLSGGIVLFQSFVGAVNSANVIRDNDVRGNSPADLANRGKGTGNTFTGNSCAASEPAGMC